MATKRTTPSMGRMLALLAGTVGVGFGSTTLAQRHGHELATALVPARVAQRVGRPGAALPKPTTKPHPSPVAMRPAQPQHAAARPKPDRPQSPTSASGPAAAPAATPAQASAPAPAPAAPPAPVSAPTLQAPVQAPAVATPAPASVVSGGS